MTNIIAILFLFFELIILIILNFYLVSLFISTFFGAPYVPTNKKTLEKILAELKPKRNKLFFELGCGDGRVVKTAVEKYHLKGIGVDINPFWIFFLKLKSFIFKINNPRFFYQDMFKTNLSKADYIYCFLMPPLLKRLKTKFEKELKKNAIVISHGFSIPHWEKNLYFVLKGKPFNTYFYRIK